MSNGMKDIMAFLADYGVTMLISGIFLYTTLQLINIGLNFLRKKSVNKKHDDLVDTRSRIDIEVQMLIDKVLLETGGDRIMVMEFHNGMQNLANLPFLFMSCTYESFREGLMPVSHLLRQVSTSLYSIFMTSLQTKTQVILDVDNREYTLARAAYELIVAIGEKNALCVVLRNLQKRPIGYVMMNKSTELGDKDISLLQDTAKQLSMLLALN
jgi:hypothetical protein